MLAENWRPARPKPTGDPAWDGRITRCCTKCSGCSALGLRPASSRQGAYICPAQVRLCDRSRSEADWTYSGIPRPAPQRSRLPAWNIGIVRVVKEFRFCLERRRIRHLASRRNRRRSRGVREPYGLFHHKFCLTTAAASNEVAVVKPITWPRSRSSRRFRAPGCDDRRGRQGCEFWAMSRKFASRNRHPTPSMPITFLRAGRRPSATWRDRHRWVGDPGLVNSFRGYRRRDL